MAKKVRVLLIEDDPDFAALARRLLEKERKLKVLGHSPDGAGGARMARELMPDLVIVDLGLSPGELDGVEAAKEIRLTTDAKVLLLTAYEQPEIVIGASKRAFASGYVFKSQCGTLAEAAYRTATSRTPQEMFIREMLLAELSPAERRVLADAVGGGDRPSASAKTIANQKTSLFKKLGLKNTGELIHVFR